MAQTLLTGDPRAVGTGNPPQDVNNLNDVMLGLGFLYNVQNTAWGADPTGTNDSTAAIMACTDAAITAGDPVIIPPGTYRVSSGTAGVPALDWRIEGLQVRGAGPRKTFIQAYGATENYPIVAVAGEGQSLGGMRFGYATQQADTSTLASCLQLGDDTVGDCFMSHFYDLELFQGCYCSQINPALTASAGFFSCQFDNIRGLGWSYSAIYWDSAAGTGYSACTGSEFNNLYLDNNPSGSAQTSLSYGIDIRNFDEIVFNQLNLEHSTINDTDWFNIQQVGNFVVNSLHCEALTLAGSSDNAGYFHVGSSTSLIVNGMTVKYATLNGTSNNPVTRFFGTGSSVDIRGFNEDDSNAFGGASADVHPWVNFGSETDNAMSVTDIAAQFLISEDSINSAAGCQLNVQGQAPTWTDTAGLALTSEGSQASITSPVSLTTGSETVLAGLTVPADDPVAGAIYKVTVFGYFTTDSTGGTVTLTATWGATSLCNIALNPTTSLTNSFWQAELIVTFVTSDTCNASLKYIHDTIDVNGWTANVNLTGTASAATVTVSSSEALAIQGTNGATSHVTFVCTGSVPERVW